MKTLVPSLALVLALGLTACDTSNVDDDFTVTAAVVADTQLGTLEAAVTEAGLAGALDDQDETYTVFAPNDAAFTAALTALDLTAQELLDRPDLAAILQLHVVAGSELEADDLEDGDTVTTLNGQTLTVVVEGGRIGLDTEDADSAANAFVSEADIEVSNGVVHKIDFVLLPN
ncbi:MAG: fasciclin domain-containing protein [Bacteroidota bacterium]